MLLGILGCLFTSCFSDLDTMPLDDNELVSERSIRQPTAIQEYLQMLQLTYPHRSERWRRWRR